MYDESTVDTWVHDILVTRMSLHDILLRAGDAASSFFALLRVVIFGRVDTFHFGTVPSLFALLRSVASGCVSALGLLRLSLNALLVIARTAGVRAIVE